MNPTIAAAIARDVATLTRVVEPSVDALGYGVDLDCVDDCTSNFDEVDPMSRHAVAQALIRRSITPRGALADDPNYGLDVRAFANRAATDDQLRDCGLALRGEYRKDDRVNDAAVGIAYDDSARALNITARIDAIDPLLGTFGFTFSVNADGARLVEIIA